MCLYAACYRSRQIKLNSNLVTSATPRNAGGALWLKRYSGMGRHLSEDERAYVRAVYDLRNGKLGPTALRKMFFKQQHQYLDINLVRHNMHYQKKILMNKSQGNEFGDKKMR